MSLTRSRLDYLETHLAGVNQNFPGIGEIDRNPVQDSGLHLPHAPIRLVRMAHPLTRLDMRLEIHHANGRSPERKEFERRGAWTLLPAVLITDMNPVSEYDRICLELASALCARLCHDISSPIGTLAGTLELVAEEPEQAEEALAIAGDAASSLVKRFQLLRAAWAGDCGPMNRTRLADLAAGLPPRVRVDLDDLAPGPFEGPVARILLNLVLLGADTLPAGGLIALAGEPETGVIVTVDGPSVAWNAELAAALLDPAAVPSEPRTVQIPLTVRLAQAAGLRLSFLLPAAPGRGAPRLLLAPG